MNPMVLAIALGKFSGGLLLVLCALTPVPQQLPGTVEYTRASNEPMEAVMAPVAWWPVPGVIGVSLMVWGVVDVAKTGDTLHDHRQGRAVTSAELGHSGMPKVEGDAIALPGVASAGYAGTVSANLTGGEPAVPTEFTGMFAQPLPVVPNPSTGRETMPLTGPIGFGGRSPSVPNDSTGVATPTPAGDTPVYSNQSPAGSKIASLAASHLSIVISAPPGTGKSVTVQTWLFEVFRKYPQAMTFIAGWKNDPWLGLSRIPGAVNVIPSDRGAINFQPLIEQVDKVASILDSRRTTSKPLRNFESQPVWLILDDYYTMVDLLTANSRYKSRWEDLKTKLGFIITVGREFFVNAAIATHSVNVAALGLSDANIRDCLNICALGKITRNPDGREDGGYGAVFKAIKNPLIVDDVLVRDRLLENLPRLQQESDRTGRPVMFCSMGHPPTLELLPDLRSFEAAVLSEEQLIRFAERLGVSLLFEPTFEGEGDDLWTEFENYKN